MEFEWDTNKAARNVAKHGVRFDYATRIFLDERRVDTVDIRRDYEEERRMTLGMIEGKLFSVAYTVRRDAIRMISARKANDRERRHYDETLSA